MLLSSDGKLPSDSRFSLVGNSSLHISGLRLEDEGHYVCREILAETNHTHRTQLLMAGAKTLGLSIRKVGKLVVRIPSAASRTLALRLCNGDEYRPLEPEMTSTYYVRGKPSPLPLCGYGCLIKSTVASPTRWYGVFCLSSVMPLSKSESEEEDEQLTEWECGSVGCRTREREFRGRLKPTPSSS
ncbi:V-set and immunoglobulin domain-containing protein 10, partial [Ophiophagus hannah]